jgi:Concanavalin A-like lectin/glucanases superfamily
MSKSARFGAPIGQAFVCSLLGALAFSACSSSGSSTAGTGASSATGGSSNGGTSASGGASVAGGSGAGGANASGGANSGGTPATGGAGTGGASSSGGSAKGDTTGTGGAASGGTSTAGGAASGGASATGGSASGGTSTGGSGAGGSGTGGSAAGGAGGKTGTTGGTTVQGGTSAVGGTSGGTGGTTGTTTCGARVLSLSANGTGSAADTADSHVEADLKTDLPIGNALRTIEFWAFIKTTDWVGDKNEIFYYGATGSAGSLGMDFGTFDVAGSTTNHATLDPFTGGAFNDDSTADLGITSSSDQWVHIAMVWDGTNLLVYVNGVLKITAKSTMSTVTALATAQSVLSIGCNPTNNTCFNGYLAEFRVWNVARAAADILANYKKPAVGNETGLVAYYKFADAAGSTTAADSVTTAGHVAHPGTLKADTTAHNPTFIAPATALPLVCP